MTETDAVDSIAFMVDKPECAEDEVGVFVRSYDLRSVGCLATVVVACFNSEVDRV